MANTIAQRQAEQWVVTQYLPQQFAGHTFRERRLRLVWGGHFAFDAVNDDLTIVALVSTSAATTYKGKQATAKIQKVKCDALYLTNVQAICRKVYVSTERSMQEHFRKEAAAGRFPNDVDLINADLPTDLHNLVVAARKAAQEEVSPARYRRS